MDLTFYRETARKLENRLEKEPQNTGLIELQLTYYERLGWPGEALRAVNRAKDVLKNDPVLIKKMADFYYVNSHFHELDTLIRDFSSTFQLPRWARKYQIESLIGTGEQDEAFQKLRAFLARNEEMADDEWGAYQYLALGDSLLSLYQFLKVSNANENLISKSTFVSLLFQNSMYEEVIDVLDMEGDSINFGSDLAYIKSVSLDKLDRRPEAKHVLLKNMDRRSAYLLSDWYVQELNWDSAHLSLNRILIDAPNDLETMWAKAEIDETRGWLTRALSGFNSIKELDSTYLDVLDRVDILNRKIAYLRKIREAQEGRPEINLESKKNSTINE